MQSPRLARDACGPAPRPASIKQAARRCGMNEPGWHSAPQCAIAVGGARANRSPRWPSPEGSRFRGTHRRPSQGVRFRGGGGVGRSPIRRRIPSRCPASRADPAPERHFQRERRVCGELVRRCCPAVRPRLDTRGSPETHLQGSAWLPTGSTSARLGVAGGPRQATRAAGPTLGNPARWSRVAGRAVNSAGVPSHEPRRTDSLIASGARPGDTHATVGKRNVY